MTRYLTALAALPLDGGRMLDSEAVLLTREGPDGEPVPASAVLTMPRDGLLVVDLRKTDPAILERYMGTPATIAFRAYHDLHADLPQSVGGAGS